MRAQHDTSSAEVQRLAAFTQDPTGGNPAGVVLDASHLTDLEMQAMAAEIGFSETAFITSADLSGAQPRLRIRYFSPDMEVDFCGHATIATGVAWARRHGAGTLQLETNAGPIELAVEKGAGGLRATLTSVPTRLLEVPPEVLESTLATLGWSNVDLDPALPPKVAFGGVKHLVLGIQSRERLRQLSYDFDALRAIMEEQEWITLQLVYRETPSLFHARNPFPVGGVVEDPATGAAAAAFGGYLRDLGLSQPGGTVEIVQGEDMGRKSLIHIEIPTDQRGIRVSGHACPMPS